MFRQIFSLIIIAVAVAVFFLVTQGNVKKIEKNSAEVDHLSSVLENIRLYKDKADQLILDYNSIETNDIDRLEKFLPDDVSNVKLILAVQNVADDLGISIKNVTYDSASQKASNGQVSSSQDAINRQTKDYGAFDMNITVTGKYPEFVTFLSQIEKSLRIVDVRQIDFAAKDAKTGVTPGSNEIYQFDIDLRTYWLNQI
jgi:Tfp pilus assembly protein PilO